MKAKDTVMSKEEILAIVDTNNKHHKSSVKWWVEASFKAGQESKAMELLDGIPAAIAQARRNGMKVVVDYVTLNMSNGFPNDTIIDWQAKLKEWGIE